MIVLFLALLSIPAFGQWANLGSGTQLASVAPQNCANTMSPAYCDGVTFAYADNSGCIVDAWSTAVARTKAGSEQLLVFGGGHVCTFDNGVYALNVSGTPGVEALTTPSIPMGSGSPVTSANITCAANADMTPLSMHSYGQLVYLPVADRMFFWADGAGNYCASAGTRKVWWFNPVAKTWTDKLPGGFDVGAGSDAQYAVCTLDPTTAHETVICEWGGSNMLLRYDATDNTWERLTLFMSFDYPQAMTLAIDPVNHLMIGMGQTGSASGVQQVIKVDISNSMYTATDITADLVNCSGMNVSYPGLVWNGHNLVGYPGTGNTVYLFNPLTATCTAQTFSGGPVAVNSTGTFGRFNYFPTLNKFYNVATASTNAFSLTFGGGTTTSGKVTISGKVTQ